MSGYLVKNGKVLDLVTHIFNAKFEIFQQEPHVIKFRSLDHP